MCQTYDNREKSAEAVKNDVSQMNDRRKETDKSKEADVVTKEADRKRQIELDEVRRQEIAPVSTAADSLRRNTDFAKNLYGMEPPKTGLRPFGINAKGSKEETLYNARQKKSPTSTPTTMDLRRSKARISGRWLTSIPKM